MRLDKLTTKETYLLSLINKERIRLEQKPINWDKMPEQEVLTHLYGWDNPHIDINRLLTPKESKMIKDRGHLINKNLKLNVPLLKSIRILRKKG